MIKNNVEIQLINELHRYPTRARENFVIPRAQTQLSSNYFYIRAFNLFNSLPAVIKNKFSLSLFKSRAKEHFYEIYCDVHELN